MPGCKPPGDRLREHMTPDRTARIRRLIITGIALVLLALGTTLAVVGLAASVAEPAPVPLGYIVLIGVGFALGMAGIGLGVIALVLHHNDTRLAQRRLSAAPAHASPDRRRSIWDLLAIAGLLMATGVFLLAVLLTVAFFGLIMWLLRGWRPF